MPGRLLKPQDAAGLVDMGGSGIWACSNHKAEPSVPIDVTLLLALQFGKAFALKERKANLLTEMRAGTVTFLTVSCYLRLSLSVRWDHNQSAWLFLECRWPTFWQSTLQS